MPPAFALSQDQTLRFITSRKHHQRPRNIINKDPTQSARISPNLPAQTKSQPAQLHRQRKAFLRIRRLSTSFGLSVDQSSRSLVNQPNQTHTQTSTPSHAQIKPELSPQPNPNITKQHLRRHQHIPSIPDINVKEQPTEHFVFTRSRRLSREPHPVGGGGF
jgi:hypothetical protein